MARRFYFYIGFSMKWGISDEMGIFDKGRVARRTFKISKVTFKISKGLSKLTKKLSKFTI